MTTMRQGVIAGLLAGSIVGGLAGVTIVSAASSRHELRTAASVQHEAQESTSQFPNAR